MNSATRILIRSAFGLAVLVVTFWSFMVPDAANFRHPSLARIFFWHFPCPMMATGLMIFGAWQGFRYLRSASSETDVRAEAANELGFVFCLITMATGIVFSLAQWGAWWQWDPRQTSFLMVLLIYFGYFVVRSSFADPERRARYSAAYSLMALLPDMFLIFVFPRLPQIAQASFHPTDSILGGGIRGVYAQVITATLLVAVTLSVWLYRMRVRAGLIALEATQTHERLETHIRDSADAPVVRPIPVSAEGGKATEDR